MPDTHFSNHLLLPLPPHVRPHGHTLPLRVGTRGSPLALVQTKRFLARLAQFCPALHMHDVFREDIICTTGDRVQDRSLAEIGGKGLFAKEIHEALGDRRIDFAVHSLKDLETALPPGIVLSPGWLANMTRPSFLGSADQVHGPPGMLSGGGEVDGPMPMSWTSPINALAGSASTVPTSWSSLACTLGSVLTCCTAPAGTPSPIVWRAASSALGGAPADDDPGPLSTLTDIAHPSISAWQT